MTSIRSFEGAADQTEEVEVGSPRPTVLAMLAAPPLLVVAELVSPIDDAGDTSAERVADILDHSDRYTMAVICLLGAMLLLVPAVLGLRRIVAGRCGWRGGAVGTSLAAAGFMLFSVASGALGVGPSAWASADSAERASLVAAFDATDGGKGAMPIVQWGPLLAFVGLIVLAVGLRRHTSYPRWAVVALPLGWAIFLFAPVHVARAVGALVLLAGFLPAVIRRQPATAHA